MLFEKYVYLNGGIEFYVKYTLLWISIREANTTQTCPQWLLASVMG